MSIDQVNKKLETISDIQEKNFTVKPTKETHEIAEAADIEIKQKNELLFKEEFIEIPVEIDEIIVEAKSDLLKLLGDDLEEESEDVDVDFVPLRLLK